MRFVYLLVLLFLFGCVQQGAVVDSPVIDITEEDANLVSVSFQPMQCEGTLWDTWYAEGNIQFFAPPTQEDLISAYYSDKGYSFESVTEIISTEPVCEACGVCPVGSTYVITTSNPEQFLADGWVMK